MPKKAPALPSIRPLVRPLAWALLLSCLCLALLVLAADAMTRWATVEKISAVSFSEVAPGSSALPPGAFEENLILPYHSIDARWWVLHARQMLAEGSWRIRHTDYDNAPEGREVHWSSFLVWVLAALAWLRSLGSGQAPELFAAEAALWAGPFLLVCLVGGLVWLACRGFGVFCGLFYGVTLLTSFAVLRTFQAGEADHHGIVLVFISASLLCLLAGGGGLAARKERSAEREALPSLAAAKRWFLASGALGSMALWVSAATALPVLAATGAGALLSGWTARHRGRESFLQPVLWRDWGLAGGAGSLVFYGLEYFPSHLGWRLEVNHPLYAVAWFGGAWLVAALLESVKERRAPWRATADAAKSALALAAVAAPLVAILFFADRVFWVSDKFLLSLHQEYILEFQSFFSLVRLRDRDAITWIVYYPWVFVSTAGVACLALCRQRLRFIPALLPVLLPAVLLMQGLALWQVRWGSAAFALWALVALLVMADALALPPATRLRRFLPPALLATAWLALLLGVVPQVLHAAKEEETCLDPPLSEPVGGNLLARDIAHRLVQSSPERLPVVLTGPNTSTEMSYHAGVRTLGTLYWENMPGLKRAAAIFCATDEAEALKLLTEAGVTHIVVPSWGDFAAAYANLRAKARGEESGSTPFFEGVLKEGHFPDWLRPFAYPIPSGTGIDAESVRIFAVLPEQSRFEALFFRGLYHEQSGQPREARDCFIKADELRPGEPRVREALGRLGDGHRDSSGGLPVPSPTR